MKFNNVASSLNAEQIEASQIILAKLLVELGVRRNNPYVGTGLGGNNFQLITLLGYQHHLVDGLDDIVVANDIIAWGSKWLLRTKMNVIRSHVDSLFQAIPERRKYLAVALETMKVSNSLRMLLASNEQYLAELPKLLHMMAGNSIQMDSSCSMLEQLLLAYVLCQELSFRLDNHDLSMINSTAIVLVEMEPEIFLMAVRQFVQLERLVKFNLDEHDIFSIGFDKVRKFIN
jgi:hypothetical protein